MTTMDRKHLTEPSPSDWERWVERLANGEEPLTAARAEGQTCTRFRRQNAEAHAEALALSREARAHEVDRRGEEWALADDASDAMKLAWAKRWNPAWAGTMHVEHGGTLDVNSPDVAQAVERFTAAVVQLAERARAEHDDSEPVGLGEGGARLQVARLERETGPASASG